MNLSEIASLTFEEPDPLRFPALRLAREVLRAGGAAALIMNAANEVAVARFLAGEIGFTDIVRVVERMLESAPMRAPGTIAEVLEFDAAARRATQTMLDEATPIRDSNGQDTIAFAAASL